jgi:hypothetical protein
MMFILGGLLEPHQTKCLYGITGRNINSVPMTQRDPSTLPPAAQRALAEAKARREKLAPRPPKEVNGPSGPEPTRYGDWERKGIASDF